MVVEKTGEILAYYLPDDEEDLSDSDEEIVFETNNFSPIPLALPSLMEVPATSFNINNLSFVDASNFQLPEILPTMFDKFTPPPSPQQNFQDICVPIIQPVSSAKLHFETICVFRFILNNNPSNFDWQEATVKIITEPIIEIHLQGGIREYLFKEVVHSKQKNGISIFVTELSTKTSKEIEFQFDTEQDKSNFCNGLNIPSKNLEASESSENKPKATRSLSIEQTIKRNNTKPRAPTGITIKGNRSNNRQQPEPSVAAPNNESQIPDTNCNSEEEESVFTPKNNPEKNEAASSVEVVDKAEVILRSPIVNKPEPISQDVIESNEQNLTNTDAAQNIWRLPANPRTQKRNSLAIGQNCDPMLELELDTTDDVSLRCEGEDQSDSEEDEILDDAFSKKLRALMGDSSLYNLQEGKKEEAQENQVQWHKPKVPMEILAAIREVKSDLPSRYSAILTPIMVSQSDRLIPEFVPTNPPVDTLVDGKKKPKKKILKKLKRIPANTAHLTKKKADTMRRLPSSSKQSSAPVRLQQRTLHKLPSHGDSSIPAEYQSMPTLPLAKSQPIPKPAQTPNKPHLTLQNMQTDIQPSGLARSPRSMPSIPSKPIVAPSFPEKPMPPVPGKPSSTNDEQLNLPNNQIELNEALQSKSRPPIPTKPVPTIPTKPIPTPPTMTRSVSDRFDTSQFTNKPIPVVPPQYGTVRNAPNQPEMSFAPLKKPLPPAPSKNNNLNAYIHSNPNTSSNNPPNLLPKLPPKAHKPVPRIPTMRPPRGEAQPKPLPKLPPHVQ